MWITKHLNKSKTTTWSLVEVVWFMAEQSLRLKYQRLREHCHPQFMRERMYNINAQRISY